LAVSLCVTTRKIHDHTTKLILWSFRYFDFFGALFWAKERDLFNRKWFTLKTADHYSFKCVAVLPEPIRTYPVVIYAHGSGDVFYFFCAFAFVIACNSSSSLNGTTGALKRSYGW
jgi:hypothetical protein